jgi:hypothetical protein
MGYETYRSGGFWRPRIHVSLKTREQGTDVVKMSDRAWHTPTRSGSPPLPGVSRPHRHAGDTRPSPTTS